MYKEFLKSDSIGIYCRLSREDEKSDISKQSESIDNQLEFLRSFAHTHGLIISKEYIDDGFSGTNFDRPGFRSMISDIENNKINVVITKDLSRLGRDYIETGYYIEKYFPSMGVRYVAITDNIDTIDPYNTNNDMTPFKSVFNDMFAKDTSKKVRAILMAKAMNGESIKAFQPYGYIKDSKCKNKILVDKNVSDIVIKIFEMYKYGNSKKSICDYLNSKNIPSPLKYKQETSNYKNPHSKNYIWTTATITKILRDQTYIGNLVQHKHTKINYKLKKVVKVNPSQYIITQNNHEPIIDKSTFNTVQIMLEKKSNEWSYINSSPHLLSGIVFCSCGGKIIYNKNHGKDFRCICSNYKKYGAQYCTNVQYWKEDELISSVLECLRLNSLKFLNTDNLVYTIKQTIDNTDFINKQIESIERKIKTLYNDKLDNLISAELFSQMSNEFQTKKEELQIRLIDIQKNRVDSLTESKLQNLKYYVKKILEFNSYQNLDRQLLLKLIDKIVIENKQIKSITYNFNISK